MTPQVRYRAWQLVVLLLLFGQPLALLFHRWTSARRTWPMLSFFEAIALLLLALLITTPADAIRLAPRRSWWLITGGTIFLYGVAIMFDVSRWPLAVVSMVITALATLSLQRAGRSGWWIVPLAWNPLLLAYFAGVAVY